MDNYQDVSVNTSLTLACVLENTMQVEKGYLFLAVLKLTLPICIYVAIIYRVVAGDSHIFSLHYCTYPCQKQLIYNRDSRCVTVL